MKNYDFLITASLLALLAALPLTTAQATEGGGDNIGKGSEGFAAGMVPDKAGWYGVAYMNSYHASRFNDGRKQDSVPGFELDANVFAGRLLYMSDLRMFGGRLGGFAILPMAHLELNEAESGARRTSFGDVTVGPVLGWDIGNFHPSVAADLVLPTGSYRADRALNTGGNVYSFRPIFAFTYLQPGAIEVSSKITYTFNGRNSNTDYRSGQLFHMDYSVSYPVTDKLRLGANGYLLKQTTDDRQRGEAVNGDGFRGQVFAIGPMAHYQMGSIGLDLKLVKEFEAKNRAEGTSFWARAVMPF